MILKNEFGERASLYEVCDWFIENYPVDIFIKEPKEVIKIRELCRVIKNKKSDE